MVESTATMPGQLALDVSPRAPADTTAAFIDYLRLQPSATNVSQELVLRFLAPFGARTALVSLIAPDATLRVAGGFGLDARTLDVMGSGSLWDDLPSAGAIRARRTLIAPTPEVVMHRYPGVHSSGEAQHSLIAVPLITTTSTVGVLCVSGAIGTRQLAVVSGVLEAIGDVYVLYLSATAQGELHETGQGVIADSTVDVDQLESGASPLHLSDRQATVLDLLRAGQTYDQIAARIGYSHSTVRMELMRIYRALNVRCRRDAISEAARLGLILT